MRQAGYLAAACIYALDNNVERLKDDHTKARVLGNELSKLAFIDEVMPVDTNIVIARLVESHSERWFLEELEKKGIKAVGFGKGLVRFVTHLDFREEDLDLFSQSILKIG